MILRTALALISLLSFAVAKFRLQLLHNNDMHARFEETEEDVERWSCESTASTNGCFGGFARVKQAADQLRRDAANQNIPTIFLNAGDTFQGTPYYNLHKWRIVAPLLDAMGFDVTTLGNHEFDDGVDNLAEFVNHIRTPIVVCNLNKTAEKRLQVPNLMPSLVLRVGTERIGVIGYLTPCTMEKARTEYLQILDEIPSLRKEAQRMKSAGINIIIALGHSGIDRDKKIAEDVEELSLIVGGHSHTMMYSPKDACPSIEIAQENYPLFVVQKSGKRVPIVQAYKYTKYLGRLLLEFDDSGAVRSAEGNPVLLDSSIPKDPEMNSLVEAWTNRSKALLQTVKGYLRVPLLRSNISAHEFESNAGNLIADAFLNHGVKRAKQRNSSLWTDAPIAIYDRDAIRTDLTRGDVTIGDVYTMVPYEDRLREVRLLGSTLLKALEYSVASDGGHYSILDVAGLRVVYDLDQPVGNRVASAFVVCKECTVPRYEKLLPDKMYTVMMTDFLLQEKNNFKLFHDNKTSTTFFYGTTATDAVIEYVEQLKYIYPKLEGRLSVLQGGVRDANFKGISFLIIGAMVIVLVILFAFHYCRYTRKPLASNFSYQYQRLDL